MVDPSKLPKQPNPGYSPGADELELWMFGPDGRHRPAVPAPDSDNERFPFEPGPRHIEYIGPEDERPPWCRLDEILRWGQRLGFDPEGEIEHHYHDSPEFIQFAFRDRWAGFHIEFFQVGGKGVQVACRAGSAIFVARIFDKRVRLISAAKWLANPTNDELRTAERARDLLLLGSPQPKEVGRPRNSTEQFVSELEAVWWRAYWANDETRPTLQQVADKMGLTKEWFSDQFRKHVGARWREYRPPPQRS